MPKKIFLWGPARSVSTAFLRAFQQRNDTIGLFEPYTDCYYFSKDRKTDMYGGKEELWERTGPIVESEFKDYQSEILFIKEMAYFGLPYIGDEIFNESVHTFIIRDPRYTLYSRKKVRKDTIGEWEFGFTALKEMWDKVRHNGKKIIVVDGDKVRVNPEFYLRKYCEELGIQFQASMLYWDDGNVKKWEEHEKDAHARFHKTLESSKGFISGNSFKEELEMNFSKDEWGMVNRALDIYHEMLPHSITEE
ncbi:hypothetical protein A3712_22135 [Vibrio sp. HI00D65]|uniref:sulfotransferase-like domain-containing protein n=1 Tax=Vibrio sp. HI00D65 TaxID=1822216 RepID=UPI0007B7AC14|nr:hypothetical protein [Vibrio sp. HI00D65]KZX62449.1 hypothetical protein A3712_22135 [Vibrio sp. HI00D65]